MNIGQLEEIVRKIPHLRHSYYGTFANDNLQPPLSFPASAIVNLDNVDQIGSHWCAFYSSSISRVDYFDPLGNPPPGNIRDFLFENFDEVFYSEFALQDVISSACGMFCLCYLYNASLKIPFESIMQKINSIADNDQVIFIILCKIFSGCM
jgi:hypothetical protein